MKNETKNSQANKEKLEKKAEEAVVETKAEAPAKKASAEKAEKAAKETPAEKEGKVGLLLKEVRMKQGKTLPEIAQELCIRKVYLSAIEESDYNNIPEYPYGIGFIRSYADYLGLDGVNIVRMYKDEAEADIQGHAAAEDLAAHTGKEVGQEAEDVTAGEHGQIAEDEGDREDGDRGALVTVVLIEGGLRYREDDLCDTEDQRGHLHEQHTVGEVGIAEAGTGHDQKRADQRTFGAEGLDDDNGKQGADGRAEGLEGHQGADDILGQTDVFIVDTQHDLNGRHDDAVQEYAEHKLAYVAAGDFQSIYEIRKDSQDDTLPFLTKLYWEK